MDGQKSGQGNLCVLEHPILRGNVCVCVCARAYAPVCRGCLCVFDAIIAVDIRQQTRQPLSNDLHQCLSTEAVALAPRGLERPHSFT